MSEEAQPLVKDGSNLNRYNSTFSNGTGHDDTTIPCPRTQSNNGNNNNNTGAAASSSATAKVQIDPPNRNDSGNLPNNSNNNSRSCCRIGLEQLKNFRFEIIVILILIICIGVTFFLVYHDVHTDFNFHEECVRCFANAVSSFDTVFNQTSGHCITTVPGGRSSLTPQDKETIVISAGFCGAPECQSKVLTGNIRVAPYWLIFLSSICAIVLSILVNFTKDVIILPLKKAFYKACDWPLPQPKNVISQLCDEEYQGDASWHQWRNKLPKARASARAIRSFGVVDPFLFLLLLAISFGHFVYVVVEVCTAPSYHDLTKWEKYEAMFGLILNSGTVEVWGIYYAQAFVGEFARILGDLVIFDPTGQDIEDLCALPLKYFSAKTTGLNGFAFFHFSAPLLIPIFITHVVPAAFIFLPMALLLLLPYGIIGYIAKKKIQVGSWDDVACCGIPHAARMYILFFVTRVVSVFCVVCFVQTLTNYSIMFYSGDYSWTEVIVQELSHRNTRCYLNAFLNKLQVYNVALAGFILS